MMNYNSENSHAGVIIGLIGVFLLFFGAAYILLGQFESSRNDLKNQCIDAGGTWLNTNGGVKCFTELKEIQLRRQ